MPWNYILVSVSKEDLRHNQVFIDNEIFFKYNLKYPFFLKYKSIVALDDDISQLKLIKAVLIKLGLAPYCISRVGSLDIALKREPALILLDLYMSDVKIDQVCRDLKSNYEYFEIPIIFISASQKREDIVGVLDSGANDYIKKPFIIEELIARIGVQFRIQYMYDEIKRFISSQENLSKKLLDLLEETQVQKEKIQEMNLLLKEKSIRDALTQVYNRGYLFEMLGLEIARTKRYGEDLAMIMFDIDHFKEVNDNHGHQAGDAILVSVAQIIQRRIRSTDMLGRYGGEEFVVILSLTSSEEARCVAEEIRKKIEMNIFEEGDKKIELTISGGVTTYQNGESQELFFQRLDQAL